jgi:hypothetical protein
VTGPPAIGRRHIIPTACSGIRSRGELNSS